MSGDSSDSCDSDRLASITEARISDEDFAAIAALVHGSFGIVINEQKRVLVVGRLQAMLRERGNISFGEYHRRVLADSTGRELSELADAISTNHTFFNREPQHFAMLARQVLPERMRRRRALGQRDLRLWCAASSTGEEPYMLAMHLLEAVAAEPTAWDPALLATDISDRALAVARAGIYSSQRASDLPSEQRARWFTERSDGQVEAGRRIKEAITFRRFNLTNAEFPFRQGFDAIFCRNVIIYFDAATRLTLIAQLARFLLPGGYLFVGHAETLGRAGHGLETVAPAVYRKKDAP
jgi:chemotaxis protein methyltransferase CheR